MSNIIFSTIYYIMSYYNKYLKYKNKYINLQYGGLNDDVEINNIKFNTRQVFLSFKETNNLISGSILSKEIQKKLKEMHDKKQFRETDNIKMEGVYLKLISDNLVLLINNEHKITKFNYNNMDVSLKINYSNLKDDQLQMIQPSEIIIKYDDITFIGTYLIAKNEGVRIDELIIQKIIHNDIELKLNISVNIKNFFRQNEYNFQENYDYIKTNYNYCIESTILYKHIYNALFSSYYIEYPNIYKILVNKFGEVINKILETNIEKYKNNIKNVCNNEPHRINLLSNVMKRINTTNTKNFLIKNKAGNYINIPQDSNIIFDTGNANITIVDEGFLLKLGYDLKRDLIKSPSISVGGVIVGATSKYDKSIELSLKLDSRNTNIYIGESEYKVIAYIKNNSRNMYTLLLGQSSLGLKPFFDNSFCVGYDSDRKSYELAEKRNNELYDKLISLYEKEKKVIDEINKFIEDLKNRGAPKEIIIREIQLNFNVSNYNNIFDFYINFKQISPTILKDMIKIQKIKELSVIFDNIKFLFE